MNLVMQIRKKLSSNELEPGAVVDLKKLMAEYGVSRTPIKESLIYLEAEGWVQRSGTHFIATPLSLERVREYTEIRAITEVETNVLAMKRMTEKEMSRLEEIGQEIEKAKKGCSRQEMINLDLSFHRVLFEATKNKQLAQFLTRNLVQYQQFWLSVPDEIQPGSFFGEIQDMIQAVKEKDETKLRSESSKHIRSTIPGVMVVK